MNVGSAGNFERVKQLNRRLKDVPGAVVIGGDYQGLGIVRSLGRRGIPICILDDERSISRYSRYATYGVRVPDLRNQETTVQSLLDLAKRLDLKGWVLFPTRDELVAAISHHRVALSEVFRVSTPSWDTIQWVWNKRNTYKLARELNIPIPETWFPDELADLDQITTPFPLVLKPGVKEHFFYATNDKAWRADSRAQLQEQFSRATELAGPREILIQDLIPGDGKNQLAYCAFFKDGKAVGSMVSRRLRQHPHEFGRASTCVETIDLPILESLSERFLRAINYYGLVEVEFKLDPRDGQYKLLDVNARTWGYHSLGFAAGVDFPFMLYADQIGETAMASRGIPGHLWIRLLTDIPTGIVEVSGRRIRLRDYLESLRHVHTDAVFSKEDPLPGIVEFLLLPYLFLKKGF
jgi:predicted ATP-grasp superfamily ATP-dependent carboligase